MQVYLAAFILENKTRYPQTQTAVQETNTVNYINDIEQKNRFDTNKKNVEIISNGN